MIFKKLQFEIITASPANYKYAQTHGGIAPAAFTDEQLAKFIDYIKTVVASKQADDYQLYLCVHGPYSYALIPKLPMIAAGLPDAPSVFFEFCIDSKDLPVYWEDVLAAARMMPVPFAVRVHTTIPDDDVNDVSSEAFAVTRALARGVATTLDIHVSADNCERIVEAFDWFKQLRRQYGDVFCKFRVEESPTNRTEFNEPLLRAQLELIEQQLNADEDLKSAVDFHSNPARKERVWSDALMSSIELVLCDDGNGDAAVFPGYDVAFMTGSAYDSLALGTTDEDITELEARRSLLIKQLDEFGNGNTGDCYDITRSVPWNDAGHEYSVLPSETLCELDSIFREYLPHNTNGVVDD